MNPDPVAGPSTPRKRSKWESDNDEENSIQGPQISVKRARSKPAKQSSQANASTSEAAGVAVPSKEQQRYTRSRFVPARNEHPSFRASRSVYSYERLNQIEEGSYGVVFRARDQQTGDIVALKKLKLEEEKHGFPITALREINALMSCQHENIVRIREVVVGDTLTQ